MTGATSAMRMEERSRRSSPPTASIAGGNVAGSFAVAARALAIAATFCWYLVPALAIAVVLLLFRGETSARRDLARRVVLFLERLGPAFVKAGQILATRRDLLPAALADELARLH